MRYYLDTNVLAVFVRDEEKDSLTVDVYALLEDDSTLLYTSSVCVHELLHLIHIGKLFRFRKREPVEAAVLALQAIADKGIEVVPVSERHLLRYAALPMLPDHRDPNDRLIIAQSIEDGIPVISSDRKFWRYERYGLKFVFNER